MTANLKTLKTPEEYLERIQDFDPANVPVKFIRAACLVFLNDSLKFLKDSYDMYVASRTDLNLPEMKLNPDSGYTRALFQAMLDIDAKRGETYLQLEENMMEHIAMGKPVPPDVLRFVDDFNLAAPPEMCNFLALIKLEEKPAIQYDVLLGIMRECYKMRHLACITANLASQYKDRDIKTVNLSEDGSLKDWRGLKAQMFEGMFLKKLAP